MRTNHFSETCQNLRKRGHTLGEIMAITHRPKGSVYFHIRQVVLSPEEAEKIAHNHALRIRESNRARKGKSLILLQEIHTLPLEMKRAFLKAFHNDEGCMDFSRVRGYQHSSAILLIIQKLLTEFHIPSKIDSTQVEIKITGREHLTRFAREINFSPGVRVNGDRSSSIWKRHLEKREILRMALASYQHVQ